MTYFSKIQQVVFIDQKVKTTYTRSPSLKRCFFQWTSAADLYFALDTSILDFTWAKTLFIKSAMSIALLFVFLGSGKWAKSMTLVGLEPYTSSKGEVLIVRLREELNANSAKWIILSKLLGFSPIKHLSSLPRLLLITSVWPLVWGWIQLSPLSSIKFSKSM